MTLADRLLLAVSLTLTAGAAVCLAQPQPAPPNLSRSERAALQAVVQAMDNNAAVQDVAERDWPVHVLRASDGSHYVAFSVATAAPASKRPIVLYVRLATRPNATTSGVSERSAVAEWLAGNAPQPPLNQRGIAFVDMPTFGAGAIASRGPGPQALQLLELERQRARQRREAEERQRRESLEGRSTDRGPRPLLPFEDFAGRALSASDAAGRLVIRRSLTAGPGDYDLLVGWVDAEAKTPGASVRIVKRRLTLAPASTTAFALSSVIVADEVTVRETPQPATEQAASPYSIGVLDITPARDHTLTNDGRLALVVQVINAKGSATGKPDVLVGFRIFKRGDTGEQLIGSLASQTYNESTVPPDFDVTRGHPLFAAVAVPMRTFKRGHYRIEIGANDRVAGTGTTTEAEFTVVATPEALLADAPPVTTAFRRADLLQAGTLEELLSTLTPPRPTAAFAAALASARAGRFAELIRDDAIDPEEAGARALLRTLAMYALGDTAASLAPPLLQSLQRSVAPAAVHLLLGAVRAAGNNDAEAIAAWEAAQAAGLDPRSVALLLSDAWLRLGNAASAAGVAERAGDDPGLLRRVAAARIAAGRYGDALAAADRILARRPDDIDAGWLALHALFAGFVRGHGPGSDAAGRTRIADLAGRHVAAKGRHAALAAEWAEAVK